MKLFAQKTLLILFAIVFCNIVEAQTCSTNIPKSAPDHRFVDNNDGTVTDLWTGLMWKQCIEGMVTDGAGGCLFQTDPITYSWSDALQRVVDVNAGLAGEHLNRAGWRLPNVKELYSITEQSCEDPAINENYFPLTYNPPLSTLLYFWSSTEYASAGAGIWFINFNRATIITTGATSLRHVRLVRTLP
jgi:hypothetical protein